MKAVFILILTFTLLSMRAGDIVVWGEKIPLKLSKTLSSIQVISEDEIEKNQTLSLTELIQKKAGITTIQTGTGISVGSIFIRGAASKNVLYLLDGIKLNNPAHPNLGFNPNLLSLNNIERIEILKGAESVLYGGNALAGVIALYTKKDTPQRKLNYTVGSNRYLQRSALLSTRLSSKSFLSVSANLQKEDSISISSRTNKSTLEKDPYRYQFFQAQFSHNLNSQHKLFAQSNFTGLKKEIDLGNIDDINSFQKNKDLSLIHI